MCKQVLVHYSLTDYVGNYFLLEASFANLPPPPPLSPKKEILQLKTIMKFITYLVPQTAIHRLQFFFLQIQTHNPA